MPLALQMIVGPVTELTFLGININMISSELSLAKVKLTLLVRNGTIGSDIVHGINLSLWWDCSTTLTK